MTREEADRLGVFALHAALVGLGMGFGMGFAPGWANGWLGLPQKAVWPVGMTAVAFLTGLAAVVCLGALVCTGLGCGDRARSGVLVAWSVCGSALVAVGCWSLYHELSAGAAKLWP